MLLKVGTFDDPGLFRGPQMVIFTIDKQNFHHVPEGVPAFERVAGLTARDERSRRCACRLARSRADHFREPVARHATNISGSGMAAGSMLIPRWAWSRRLKRVTFAAAPVSGP